MTHTLIAAAVQTAVLILALYRCRRYPAFLASLAASLPFLWISPDLFSAPHHAVWERCVWLPCAFVLIPAQAVAALEAFFRFGERYWMAAEVSAKIGMFAIAGTLAFWSWPYGDVVGQVVQVARYQRVGCCIFLLLAVGFYGVVRWQGLVARREGAHLVLMAAWAVTWMVPTIRPIPPTWATWLTSDWMITARTCLLVAWVPLVCLRRATGIRGCPCALPARRAVPRSISDR